MKLLFMSGLERDSFGCLFALRPSSPGSRVKAFILALFAMT